jgi:hypothetical protein
MVRGRAGGEDFIVTRWIVALSCAVLIACPRSVLAAVKLAPKDIQATFFTGQPFTAATPSNVKFKMVFTPDGKATREPMGKAGIKGQGTWKLSTDGFCTAWSGATPNCYTLVASGDNKWSVMNRQTLAAIWSK